MTRAHTSLLMLAGALLALGVVALGGGKVASIPATDPPAQVASENGSWDKPDWIWGGAP